MTRIELNRAGFSLDDGKSMLAIQLGQFYIDILKYLKSKDVFFYKYAFAHIFEHSDLCGESGVHQYISEIIIGEPKLKKDEKGVLIYPVSAILIITLKEYDKLRLTRSFPRTVDMHELPPYVKVG